MDMSMDNGRPEGWASDLWSQEGDQLVEQWDAMPPGTRYNILRTKATLSEEEADTLQHKPLAEIVHKLEERPNALYIVLSSTSMYGRPKPQALTVRHMPARVPRRRRVASFPIYGRSKW